MRLFLIGNSFSADATFFLPDLAAEAGHDLQIGMAALGGCPLGRHWELHLESEANPASGPYDGRTLRELLTSESWDIVSLQQASVDSANPASYHPYARKLWDLVGELCPSAQRVWHQTWAYRADSNDFAWTSPTEQAPDQRTMWEKSREAYHAIAAELGAPLVPVGDAFWQVNSDPEWPSPRDPDFDFENPQYPDLPRQPNSLHVGYTWWGEGEPYEFGHDPRHASPAGRYLGALVWFGFLFRESPATLSFAPPEVPADFAAYLRAVAAGVTGFGA